MKLLPFVSGTTNWTFRIGVTVPDWRRSSFSYANGNCVEVSGLSTERIRVRDSKNPQGPQLEFTPSQWSTLLSAIRSGASVQPQGTKVYY